MKSITGILLLSCIVLKLSAQVVDEKKPSALAFHVFYNDFKTAQLIRTTSLNNVFSNNLWSRIGDLQMGFGFNYLKGITKKIDFVSSLDGSATDYLFKNGAYNGSNKFLLDANAGLNFKLLTDSHAVVPYLSAGAGFSMYQGKTGLYVPVGAGIQFNLFNEVFVFTNMQYRRALSADVNDHFQYNIGLGASLGKKKKTSPVVVPPVNTIKIAKPDTIPAIVKIPVKNLVITVTDAQTGLPLPSVTIVITGPDGNVNGLSDANGQVNFNAVKADDYTVSGTFHGISTSIRHIEKNSFESPADDIKINITHNDPRFTLTGVVSNKSTNKPESGVTVSAFNPTQNSSADTENQPGDGAFSIQLAAASDFTVSGKKAGYISNIEKVSTKLLDRSTVLYVKLELGIEQTLPGKAIVLANIYYNTGSSKFRAEALPDLEKLVKFLKDNPGLKIEIDSHTDSRGSAVRNLKLSQARALEVVNYLQKEGIEKNRLLSKGYGATKLVNGCIVGVKCSEAQHEQNRRTEFKVIK